MCKITEIVEPVIIFKRGNHPTFLSENKYQQYLDLEKDLDVTLVVEGEKINAHRLLLCASSQYFEARHKNNIFFPLISLP